jgi:2-oxoglutarate ferredoxin oxidoreductase subunit delta
MPSITVDRDRCKGCELCNHYCPQKILGMSKEINLKGYFFAQVVDPGRCIGCMLCAITCPDVAITVQGNAVQYKMFDYAPTPDKLPPRSE